MKHEPKRYKTVKPNATLFMVKHRTHYRANLIVSSDLAFFLPFSQYLRYLLIHPLTDRSRLRYFSLAERQCVSPNWNPRKKGDEKET